MRAVRQRRTRAQGGRNEDCFAEFDFSRASVKRCLAMDLDAVGHCVVRATAIAINSLYFFGIAPSASAASSSALKPPIVRGANAPSLAIFFRLLRSNIQVPFASCGDLT